MIVLSYVQAEPLLEARESGKAAVQTSADLGRTSVEVRLDAAGAHFPGGETVGWEALETIRASEVNCYRLEAGAPREIKVFSEENNRVYTLMPTRSAPTMLISGIPMHRIKDVDPWQDTRRKIKTITPIVGRVLDTSTGLGYTALAAAETAEHVTTIEFDPAVLEIARLNPWSHGLFDSPRITQLVGDSFDLVAELADQAFSRIIHDPPTFSLAGHLYSGEFYRQLYRVLRNRGRLFHYIGNPDSASGHRVTKGVVRRLKEAGFTRVDHRPEAFGVTATK